MKKEETHIEYVISFTLRLIKQNQCSFTQRCIKRIVESRILLQRQVLCLRTAHRKIIVTQTIR